MQELRGLPVVNRLAEQMKSDMLQLQKRGIVPTLAIIRIGEKEDDLAYERGILSRFASVGAAVQVFALPIDATQNSLEEVIISLNKNKGIHGILLFRPLPKHLSEDKIKSMILPEKDVDCITLTNNAYVFAGKNAGYPPCTPQAVMELLDFYGIDPAGKKVTVVGRSLVVGKPLAMLLLAKNATVTLCHTKTENLPGECRRADILIACAGVAKMINQDYVHAGQIVIDVGIHMDNGKLCGDVDYSAAANIAKAITPVPGGVGSVTTSVLLGHTIQSAMGGL